MKKIFLALALFVCQPIFSSVSFEDFGYHICNIEYDGHFWIVIQDKNFNHFELLHHPDCEKCYLDEKDFIREFDNFYSCVTLNKKSNTYVVDPSGCVK